MLDLGEGGCVCAWKSRMPQKGAPRRDNIQVRTKAMHAEPAGAPQCSPSSDSCAVKERPGAALGMVRGKQYPGTQRSAARGWGGCPGENDIPRREDEGKKRNAGSKLSGEKNQLKVKLKR